MSAEEINRLSGLRSKQRDEISAIEAERDKWREAARSLAGPLRSLIEEVDEDPIWRQWAKDRGVGDADTVQLIESAEGELAAYDAAVEEAEKCTTPNPT